VADQEIQKPHLPYNTKAVLFDLDDTLHHRSRAYRGWAQAFALHHCQDNPALCQELAERLIQLDEHGYAQREDVFSQLKHDYPFLQGSVEALMNTYWRDVIAHVVLEPEIAILIHALQDAQIPFGIVTNGIASQQKRKITQLGFDAISPCVFISGEFGVSKPHPSIFRAAARCLATKPEDILFVGDHPRFDMWGAHAVGMKTVWVHHDPRIWPADIPQDILTATIHSFAELLPLFGIADTIPPTAESSKML